MLDNTHVGQRNIVSNFGVAALPSLTWQIDPFGHSAFQGVMSGPLSGYVGVMWGREAAEFRASSQSNRMIERVWMPSPSLGSNAACFQGIFAGGGYGPPASVGRCNGSRDPKTCNAALAAGDVELLKLDLLFDRSIAVRGPDVLLMFGTDFTGENMDDAGGPNTGYFSYLDELITLLNADPQHRFNAFYSSGAQYAAAKLASVKSLPLLRGDLFPYNDDAAGHNMWCVAASAETLQRTKAPLTPSPLGLGTLLRGQPSKPLCARALRICSRRGNCRHSLVALRT